MNLIDKLIIYFGEKADYFPEPNKEAILWKTLTKHQDFGYDELDILMDAEDYFNKRYQIISDSEMELKDQVSRKVFELLTEKESVK